MKANELIAKFRGIQSTAARDGSETELAAVKDAAYKLSPFMLDLIATVPPRPIMSATSLLLQCPSCRVSGSLDLERLPHPTDCAYNAAIIKMTEIIEGLE